MRHSYYASNGHAASGPRIASATQGEAVRLTPTDTRTQREDAQHDSHDRDLAVELKRIVTAQRALSHEIEVGRRLIETLLMAAVELSARSGGSSFSSPRAKARNRGRGHDARRQHSSGFPARFGHIARISSVRTALRHPDGGKRSAGRHPGGKSVLGRRPPARRGYTFDPLCLPLIAQRWTVGSRPGAIVPCSRA